MEVDTGASVSIMSEGQYKQLWPGRSLRVSAIRLETYSKQSLVVLGSLEVQVAYESQVETLPLVVVKGEGPTLFGRNWLKVIKINWSKIHYTLAPGLQEVLARYPDMFQGGLGTYKGQEVSISVDPEATPRFCKARPLPYAMRPAVEDELNRLVKEGTLEPIDYSDWAAPIVAVLKGDRTSVRVCGDFRMTVNPVSKLNHYPIPKVEDLFATLAEGKVFTKLDLAQAYQQIKLDAQSKKYVVINTHKGLFQYSRLPFGVSSAPGIFQKLMETLLQGVPGVIVYIDDILIPGVVQKETGPVSFHVELSDGRTRRCHLDQLRNRSVDVPQPLEVPVPSPPPVAVPDEPLVHQPPAENPSLPAEPGVSGDASHAERDPEPPVVETSSAPAKRYPCQHRKTVIRFEPQW